MTYFFSAALVVYLCKLSWNEDETLVLFGSCLIIFDFIGLLTVTLTLRNLRTDEEEAERLVNNPRGVLNASIITADV